LHKAKPQGWATLLNCVAHPGGLGNMPWHCREFVVKDCDGRLLAFGANL
jgi:hypothetical protein